MKKSMGILILVIGISIFFYPDYQEWKTQKEIQRIMETVPSSEDALQTPKEVQAKQNPEEDTASSKDETEEEKLAELQKLLTAMQEYNEHLLKEGQDITDAWDFSEIPEEITSLNPKSHAVGYLDIPELSLSLPLYLGATEENMSNGAVVLAQSSMPIGGTGTNSVIAAHRGWKGSAYFRDIDQLSIGSKICIHNLWEDLVYEVSGTEIISATQCEILRIEPEKDMVTLFSCYPYMSPGTSYRLVIYCERVTQSDEPAKEQDTATVKELVQKELEEKGIVIKEEVFEGLSQKEDLLRRAALTVSGLAMLFFLLLCFKKRK